MAIIPMSYSPATIQREYRLIGEASITEKLVEIYLHQDRDLCVAVFALPEDINGQLRHVVLAKIDLKTRHSDDDNETILAVVDYFESSRLNEIELLQVEGVTVMKRQRNALIASSMYEALINDGIILVSDNVQYPGGKALWERIARLKPEIDVFVFDSERREFWPYDGERVRYDGKSIPESDIWSLSPDESRQGVVLVAERRKLENAP